MLPYCRKGHGGHVSAPEGGRHAPRKTVKRYVPSGVNKLLRVLLVPFVGSGVQVLGHCQRFLFRQAIQGVLHHLGNLLSANRNVV